MISLLELLFAFGTLPFWITLALLMIVIWGFQEAERFGFATVWLGGTIAALMFANPTLLGSIRTHPTNLVVMALGYVVVGMVYSVGRWKLFLVDILGKARDGETWKQGSTIYVKYHGDNIPIPPSVRSSKGRIIGWMAYWPWSGIWFLIHDPITRLYRVIYENLSAFLQGMSDRTFAEFNKKDEEKQG
jgi:hypothetical protein